MRRFRKLLQEAKRKDTYWSESAKLDFALELERFRRLTGVKYNELARRLGTSPAYISKVFRGDANLTIETMAKLARAMQGRLRFHIAPEVASTRWIDVIEPDQQGRESALHWARSAGERRSGRVRITA